MRIQCYACNEVKEFPNWMPFAICRDCTSPEKIREQEIGHVRAILSIYWRMKPIEQEGILALLEDCEVQA